MSQHRAFWSAGFRVFGIFGMSADSGRCECGNPRCISPLKHPVMSNWQYAPVWSEEQMETMEEVGSFDHGYGILCHEMLVVDVDERRGGLESFAKLCEEIPQVSGAGLVVETGSGNGSKHLYFRIPPDVALVTQHRSYPGIDFKNGSAFVIGPGSKHASGREYTTLTGSPDEVSIAPDALLTLLEKPRHHRAEYAGRPVDVSYPELEDMLAHIPNDAGTLVDYDTWLWVGMALHHSTGGAGQALWDAWSANSPKFTPGYSDSKWHSFGKSANPVTLGTLIHYAQKGGWREPVTFVADPEFQFAMPMENAPAIDISGVDLKRPPGAVGLVARWIEDQTRRPRERLSAVAALAAVGNVVGLRYTDDLDRVTTNIFMFGVADSGTGKEAVQTAVRDIHAVAGLSPATHGALKSEQEVARNLTRHQMCAYVLDEVGITLRKIKNAQQRGGAPYLDGIIGILMSAYSKANGHLLLSGDMKEDVRADLEKKLTRVERQLDEGASRLLQVRRDNLAYLLSTLDQGLEKPFLSVCGFTTLKTFNEIVDYENAANGFIGRSLLAVELDSAPPRKRGFTPREMPENLAMMIRQMATGGDFDLDASADRVESYKPRKVIPSTPEAMTMLEMAGDILDEMAVEQKGTGGLEALALRGYEMIAKVSLILAAPEGLRTEEHVRWSYALVRKDIETKVRMVTANDRAKDDPAQALRSKILSLIDDENGETLGVIVNRARGYKQADVELLLDRMVDSGEIVVEETIHKFKKNIIRRYKPA